MGKKPKSHSKAGLYFALLCMFALLGLFASLAVQSTHGH